MSMNFQVAGLNKIAEKWSDDGANFFLEIHVELVEDGRPGGEAFRVFVCSPAALADELQSATIESGRGYLFMNDFVESRVVNWLQRFVDAASADTWNSLEEYVNRHFDWV